MISLRVDGTAVPHAMPQSSHTRPALTIQLMKNSNSGLARKFDHVSVKGSVPTLNSFLSVNDPERPSTVYSDQHAEQESGANAHTMGRHFTRVAIYSRISNDPPRHQAGGVRRHLA
jgi:hypothetical protein